MKLRAFSKHAIKEIALADIYAGNKTLMSI